jgi:UDP-N-acetylmuramate--alanine ligase
VNGFYSALGKTRHVHLIGIGGAGMSAISQVLINQGFIVSGSDMAESDVTRQLEAYGAKVYYRHDRSNVDGADVVVHSSAVDPATNEEVLEAHIRMIPVIKRDEMLGELMRRKAGICIAGTHGKTTTTTMVGTMLNECGVSPTMLIGGISDYFNGSAVVGDSDYMVIEADEYDRAFLKLTPTIAVITTIEAEHLDIYKDLKDIQSAFVQFANSVPFYGAVICCNDDPDVSNILTRLNRRVITYGTNPDAELQAKDLVFKAGNTVFTVSHLNEELGHIEVNVPGLHNVKNILAAIAVGLELGLDFGAISKALEKYQNVRRRFQIRYQNMKTGVSVVDDYAHHPTEIRATLNAARWGWPKKKLIAVFQPHLYSRTKYFAEDFGKALSLADEVVITDIYKSREDKSRFEGVTGELIKNMVRKNGHDKTTYVSDLDMLTKSVLKLVKKDQMVVYMGAGNITRYAGDLIDILKSLE